MVLRQHAAPISELRLNTVEFLQISSAVVPDREALVEVGGSGARISYMDMYPRVVKLANALQSLGVEKGNRVAVIRTFIECNSTPPNSTTRTSTHWDRITANQPGSAVSSRMAARPFQKTLVRSHSSSRMWLRDTVATAQHSQNGVLVRDEPGSAVRIGSNFHRRIVSQHQQRDAETDQ